MKLSVFLPISALLLAHSASSYASPHNATKTLCENLRVTSECQAEAQAFIQSVKKSSAQLDLNGLYIYRAKYQYQDKASFMAERDSFYLKDVQMLKTNHLLGQPSFGYQDITSKIEGNQIDWRANPYPDAKEWPWQLHRLNWAKSLAAVYQKTKDESLVDEFKRVTFDWIKQAPLNTQDGVAWRTLEVTSRLQALQVAYLTMIDSPKLSLEDHATIINSLYQHAQAMSGQSPLPGTKTGNIGNFMRMGIAFFAGTFHQFPTSKQWLKEVRDHTEDLIMSEIYPDGAHFELTTSYHYGILEALKIIIPFVEQGGLSFSSEAKSRFYNLYQFSQYLTFPDNTLPRPGHSHGTPWQMQIDDSRQHNLTDALWVATQGKEGTKPNYLDTANSDAGFYMMRSAWHGEDAMAMFVDGAHAWSGWHSDLDYLNVELRAFNRYMLVDGGKFSYSKADGHETRHTNAHNTVSLHGENQTPAPSKLNHFTMAKALSFIDVENQSYPQLNHRRQIAFVRPNAYQTGYFIFIDTLTPTKDEPLTMEQNWHLMPAPVQFGYHDNSIITKLEKDEISDGNLLIREISNQPKKMQDILSFVALKYREKTYNPAVRYSITSNKQARFITLVMPFKGLERPAIDVANLSSPSGVDIAISLNGQTSHLVIDNLDAVSFKQYSQSEGSSLRFNTQDGLGKNVAGLRAPRWDVVKERYPYKPIKETPRINL